MIDNARILVFIPAYRCAAQIVRVLDQFRAPEVHRWFDEILVLDNRSPDGTAEAALAHAAGLELGKVRVARNIENYGLGGSHKAAFAYAEAAGFTHVVVLHGDDQGRIGDLLPVLERGDHHGFDACLGSRFMGESQTEGYSRFRLFGNHVFNWLFSAMSGRRVLDLGSGLNIFARSVFSDPSIKTYSDDLRFNVFLLLGMVDKPRKMTFFPISWREEDQISNVKIVSQSAKTLQIGLQYLLARRRFQQQDHRDIPRASYQFEVLPLHETEPSQGAR